MQLTVENPQIPEERIVLTLRLDSNTELRCSVCGQRAPDWFDDPASETAMNPEATPLRGPDTCTECLNVLIDAGVLEVVEVDPRSF